jgi:CRP/FNR family transcriptional regulator, cyclic AMP receptor protein
MVLRLVNWLTLLSMQREEASGLVKIDHMLAEMVGTTRSRISFFMNRFRKLGFIRYNGELEVHSSLLNIVLQD